MTTPGNVAKKSCNCLECLLKTATNSVQPTEVKAPESKGWYRDPKNLMSMSQYLNSAVVKVDEDGNVVVQPADPSQGALWKYKTVMCKSWLLTQACPYEGRCRFAHGEHELQQTTNTDIEHPKYKTKTCKNFTVLGLCPFGARCLFIHPTKEPTSQQTSQQSQCSMATAKFLRSNADKKSIAKQFCYADSSNC